MLRRLTQTVPPPGTQFANEAFLAVQAAGALALFGIAMWWVCFAVMGVVTTAVRHRSLPYTVAWWGAVFPIGLLGFLALRLDVELDVLAFRYVGVVLSFITVAAWVYVALHTVHRLWSGSIFLRIMTVGRA